MKEIFRHRFDTGKIFLKDRKKVKTLLPLAATLLLLAMAAAVGTVFLLVKEQRRQPEVDRQSARVARQQKLQEQIVESWRRKYASGSLLGQEEKESCSRHLYENLITLANMQRQSGDILASEKTLLAAMPLCDIFSPCSSEAKARLFKDIACCKSWLRDYPAADRVFSEALQLKSCPAETTASINFERAMMRVAARNYAGAQESFELSLPFIRAYDRAQDYRYRPMTRLTIRPSPCVLDRAVDLYEKLNSSKDPLKDEDLPAVIKLLNRLSEIILDEKSPFCKNSLEKARLLLEKMDRRHVEFKPLAAKTYLLLCRLENELKQNPEKAGEYRRLSESFSK